ncbi:MAG TPA: ATP-binding protein [Gaiellales bacterium]|nr:ATP-binding protein [Gaiellales bacterium]
MAAVLILSGSILYLRVGSHLSSALDRQLRLRANDLAVLAARPGRPLASEHRSRFVETGESYAQVLDGRGHVLDSTGKLGRASVLSADELRRALAGAIFTNRESVPGLDEPSRILATHVTRQGRRLVLVVGITREDRAETLRSLRDELLIAGPIALLLATLAGYALAGLALRPVESMRRRAAAISAERPGDRLPVPQTRDEVERLGETLNAMLARLEAALLRERTFVADAGHELRTPLALLRTELELALRHGEGEAELRDALRRSSEEVDRLTQLAEALLLIARSDQGQLELRLEELEASDLLDSIATRFEWRAKEAGRPLSVSAEPGLQLRGDGMRLEQALGNLVENALRHGDGEVTLSATGNDGVVELHVRDEGAGFPPAFIPDAFTRFARPDQARARAGSGLGLSIVRTIAEAHEGGAQVVNLPAGGADVWLTLPRTGPLQEPDD